MVQETNSKSISPVVLLILDGWGIAPPSRGNAITAAKTPVFNKLIKEYPVMTLQASGEAVGLNWGEMGNSEVGHLNLGSGRIIYQNLPRINKTIMDGSFFANPVLLQADKKVKQSKSSLHLVGLVSDGGIHSHQDHLHALLDFCSQRGIDDVFIHVFLDGRDTSKNEGMKFIEELQAKISGIGIGRIATISGRFYAMDRDNRWDRIAKSYYAMTKGEAKETFSDPVEAIESSYDKKVYDEEFVPTVITDDGKPVGIVDDGDVVIFFNFRGDRGRQLTSAFTIPGFEKFKREKYLRDLLFVTFTEYDKNLPVVVAFPPQSIVNPMAKIVSDNKLKQLHAAETEKYAHVTFFFNGGKEDPFPGEDRILIPSPSITSYDERPEMSAVELTKRVVKQITKGDYSFIVVNYANPDMVAHTGNLQATVKAVQAIDKCLGEIIRATEPKKGTVIITADHGNAEKLVDLQLGEIDKEHSSTPVPFVVVGSKWRGKASEFGVDVVGDDLSIVAPSGVLADVAPTILKIMGLPVAKEMDGRPLI